MTMTAHTNARCACCSVKMWIVVGEEPICDDCDQAREQGREEIERLRAERERLERNLRALGESWRGDWSDFDGRQLRTQLDEIVAGVDTGLEFYHERKLDDEKCPWKCPFCEEEG